MNFRQEFLERGGVLRSDFENMRSVTRDGVAFENVFCALAMLNELFVVFGRFAYDENKACDVVL